MPILPKSKRPYWIPKKKVVPYSKSGFYHTPAWRNARNKYISDNPLCAECKRNSRDKAGWLVDHIIPISQGGEPLDEANLQTLCKHCHAVKTGNEQTKKK